MAGDGVDGGRGRRRGRGRPGEIWERSRRREVVVDSRGRGEDAVGEWGREKVASATFLLLSFTCSGRGRSRVGAGGCQVGTAGSVGRLGLGGPHGRERKRGRERELGWEEGSG